jgi:hypothetical protein
MLCDYCRRTFIREEQVKEDYWHAVELPFRFRERTEPAQHAADDCHFCAFLVAVITADQSPGQLALAALTRSGSFLGWKKLKLTSRKQRRDPRGGPPSYKMELRQADNSMPYFSTNLAFFHVGGIQSTANPMSASKR